MDEAILKGYNECIAVSELSSEDIITMNGCVEDGTKAETKVIIFHKRLIPTMNDDLPTVEIIHICDKEKELKILT